ncbi:MAG TPA: PHB depolymerase family esterase [Planctomycetota bacterium]|nr:PHB depolymerase family esterase [Planctomycetota bacterium]
MPWLVLPAVLTLLSSAFAATLTTDRGVTEGMLLYHNDDFTVVADLKSDRNAVLFKAAEIKEIKADPLELKFARLRSEDVKLAPQLTADPDTLPPLRTLLKDEIPSWYGGTFGLDIQAEKIERAEALIHGILTTRRADLQKTWTEQLEKLQLTPAQLRAIVREGYLAGFAHGKPGRWIVPFSIEQFPQEKMLCVISVPGDYTPEKRWPLIVWLHHTGPGDIDASSNYPAEVQQKYIILSPWAKAAHGWGPSRLGRASLWSALDAIMARYRIDTSRMYVEGMSMGGVGARKNAIWAPDRFAAVCARSGPPLKQNIGELYANLHSLPMLALCGSADPLIPCEQFKWERDMAAKLKLPVTVRIEEGGDHSEYRQFDDEVYAFFAQNTRNAFPRRLTAVSYEDGTGLAHYYLEMEPDNRGNSSIETNVLSIVSAQRSRERDSNALLKAGADPKNIVDKVLMWMHPRRVTLEVDRDSNTMTVTRAERVLKLRIYLDSDLVDMTKPVKVKIPGREAVIHVPRCRLEFMLDEARRRKRRDITYWDVIEVPLK